MAGNFAIQAGAGFVLAWIVWKLASRFVFKSPLDILQAPPSASFLSGNIPQIFNMDGWKYNRDLLSQYGRAFKVTGAFGERILFTFDPKALHHILVKDQHIYEEAAAVINRNLIFVGPGLVATLGEQHRKQRKMINPVFSINHMCEMIPLFYEVTERLRVSLKKKTANGPKEVDIMQWMTRTALELIGQSGMGYSFDTLESEEVLHPYAVYQETI